MFQSTVAENKKFMFSNFSPKTVPFMTTWKNIIAPDRQTDDKTIEYDEGKNTHALITCNSYYFSTAIMLTRTRLNVTLYVLAFVRC